MDLRNAPMPTTPTAPPDASCGHCTLCCKLLGVVELSKPKETWCPHCDKGRGCRVYDARPEGCRIFSCLWLTAREAGPGVPDGLRPDRSHVVFHERAGQEHLLVAHVDPAYPKAWLEGPGMALIASVVPDGWTVVVSARDRHFVVDGTGIHEARITGILADGGEALEKVRRIGGLADAPGADRRGFPPRP
jgi:hypothetical protein